MIDELEPLLRRSGDLWLLQWTVFESRVRPPRAAGTTRRRSTGSTRRSRSAGAAATPPRAVLHRPPRLGAPAGRPARRRRAAPGGARRSWPPAPAHVVVDDGGRRCTRARCWPPAEPAVGGRRPPARPRRWPTSRAPRPTCCAASAPLAEATGDPAVLRAGRRAAARRPRAGRAAPGCSARTPTSAIARAWRRAGDPDRADGILDRLPRGARRRRLVGAAARPEPGAGCKVSATARRARSASISHTTTEENSDGDRQGQADGVPGPLRRRPRRDDRGRQRRHRPPARPLPRAGRAAPRRPTSWPSAPAPTPATSPSGCAARPPAATSSTTPRPATLLADRGAGLRADRPGRRRSTLPGAFVLALGALQAEPRITEAFRTGAGRRLARARRGRVRRLRAVLPARLPRQPGARAGSRRSTASRPSCEPARRSPTSAAGSARRRCCWPRRTRTSPVHRLGLPRRVDRAGPQAGRRRRASPTGSSFEVASAPDLRRAPATTWSTTFDCLHDMGDPLGAARHIRAGARAGRHLADRRAGAPATPSRTTSTRSAGSTTTFSTFLCVPNALSQPGGYALGAQAGEAAIRQVVTDAGLHPVPPGRRDAVQPRLRGPSVAGRARSRAPDPGARDRSGGGPERS